MVYTANMTGEVHGDTQADIRTAIIALQGAYSIQNQPWGLYHDDGTTSAHYLGTQSLVRPLRVVQPPSFPDSDGAEYATKRTYSIQLEAEYFWDGTPQVLEWSESVSITGTGGPIKVVVPTLIGNPIQQQLTNTSVVRAVQQGSAVGWTAYPTEAVPPPYWPQYELVHLRENATQSGVRSSGFVATQFPLSWKYTFESAQPLIGVAGTY